VEFWENKKNFLMDPRVLSNSRRVNNSETKKRAHNNIEEEKLNQWVLDCRNENICVTIKGIYFNFINFFQLKILI
jgi:hypothetical protein